VPWNHAGESKVPTLAAILIHSELTRLSGHRYQFTPKHHGADLGAATWRPEISLEAEFAIFDNADSRRVVDGRGWLYGILRDPDGDLQPLGTWDEQVAEFQLPSPPNDPWHGYPQWALDETGPANRRKQQCCPERTVFDRMAETGMISRLQRKRLLAGRFA
jgi:hypothetical protein